MMQWDDGHRLLVRPLTQKPSVRFRPVVAAWGCLPACLLLVESGTTAFGDRQEETDDGSGLVSIEFRTGCCRTSRKEQEAHLIVATCTHCGKHD
jgi:hypothetical protein